MLTKIISGAQTGGDRAGLDAALLLGLQVGGWVPKGCRTDEGPLTSAQMTLYGLKEHPSYAYPPRTEQNVRESDGTVLFGDMSSPGCRLTIRLCKMHGQPFLANPTPDVLRSFVLGNAIKVLNVAGNRERVNPGIYATTYATIVEAFRA